MNIEHSRPFLEVCATAIKGPEDLAALFHGLKDQRPMNRDAKYLKEILLRILGLLHDQAEDEPIDVPASEPAPVVASLPSHAGNVVTQADAYVLSAERMVGQHTGKSLEEHIDTANLGQPLLVALYAADTRKGVRQAIVAKFEEEEWELTPLGIEEDDGDQDSDGDE